MSGFTTYLLPDKNAVTSTRRALPWLVVLTLLTGLSGRVRAQQVEVFGYFEPQVMAAWFDNQPLSLTSNKLRVDLRLDASDQVSFAANFDYITYHGKTRWDVLDFIPDRIKGQIPDYAAAGFNPYVLPFEDRNFLDNAYLKLSFKRLDVTIGKQQISPGTGYAWNPTDVFNKKDVTDPTYEQPGHNALRFDVPLGQRINTTFLYAPSDQWDDPDLLIKGKINIGRFDLALLGIRKNWTYSDARIFDAAGFSYHQIRVRRDIIGADFAGELFGLGIRGEAAWNRVHYSAAEQRRYLNALAALNATFGRAFEPEKIQKNFYELVLGADYTTDAGTYFMLEYYRNSRAEADYKKYTFNDWMQYLLAEERTVGRDQLYALIQHPWTDLIDVGTSFIYSISDYSLAVLPMLTYNMFENVDLTLIGNVYLGAAGRSYASDLGSGGLLRARVYF